MNTIQTIIDFIQYSVRSAFQVNSIGCLNSIISLYFVTTVGLIVPLLIGVAYFTNLERKRMGPNVKGIYRIFQPLADGFKLFINESLFPSNANSYLFAVAPMILFTFSVLSWCLIPIGIFVTKNGSSLSLMYIWNVGALGLWNILHTYFWISLKSPVLDSFRLTAQRLPYEIIFTCTLLIVVATNGLFDLPKIVEDLLEAPIEGYEAAFRYTIMVSMARYRSFDLHTIVVNQVEIPNIFLFGPIFMLVFIGMLEETHRFRSYLYLDLAKSEFSTIQLALFSFREYCYILDVGLFSIIFFFGGWLSPFQIGIFSAPISLGIKICIFALISVWIIVSIPRYWYDQLLRLRKVVFLPIMFLYIIVILIMMYVAGYFSS
jgi:NADH-quinone oxidoreductase subunit H